MRFSLIISGIVFSLLFFVQNGYTLWINEFCYNPEGPDTDNEFIEIVVDPNNTIPLSSITMTVYNYVGYVTGAHTLDNFSVGSTVEGYTILYLYNADLYFVMPNAGGAISLDISGVVIPGQFVSYETFSGAIQGPAVGYTAEHIPFEQDGTEPAFSSIALEGIGSQYSDFIWSEDDNFPAGNGQTPGEINNGQTFLPAESVPEPLSLLLLGVSLGVLFRKK